MKLGVYIFFGSIAWIVMSQYLTGALVGEFFSKILITAREINEKLPSAQLKKELEGLEAVSLKKKRLKFITITIGCVEAIVFAGLILILKLHHNQNNFAIISDFSKFLGVWIAIKTLGNYGQWSGSIFGRATFYTFIIGTLINILFAIPLGLVLAYVFS